MTDCRTTGTIDQAVARLASRQHGVFTRTQARNLGATEALVQRRRSSGAWKAEAPGVYGLPGAVHTWQRRLMVAHLDLGPTSVVSHRAAAALLGFPGFGTGSPELSVPLGAGRSRRWRVHEATDLRPADRSQRDGVPVTSSVRTTLDLAAVVGPERFERLVDALLAAGVVSLGPLVARFAGYRCRGRPGVAQIDRVLTARGPGYVPPESELEAVLFEVLRAAGLAEPVRQHPLPARTGRGRVDAAWPEARLVVEVDGRRWHSAEETRDQDRRRDIEAGLRGWTVVRFAWGDLVRTPDWVCDVVRHHLAAAA